MKLLDRSRSLRKKEPTQDLQKEEVSQQAEPACKTLLTKHERRTSVFQTRPKSANGRKSLQRPRTANNVPDRIVNLPVIGQTIEIRQGGDTFSFPTPSPRLPPPRSATFQSSPSPLGGVDSPPIGVAIGSPTQIPYWGRSFTSDHISSRMPRQPPPTRAPATIPEHPAVGMQKANLKRKNSGWRTLGLLFQRKPSKSATQEPFHKVRPEPEPVSTDQAQRPVQIGARAAVVSPGPITPESISSLHSRTPSNSRGIARLEARAEADRASLMPKVEQQTLRRPSMIQRQSMAPPGGHSLHTLHASEDRLKTLQEERQDSPLSPSGGAEMLAAVPRTPRLDTDIPNGEMERYSVMFEKLLQIKPSLLERRQTKLERMKSKREESAPPSATALEVSEEGKAPATSINLPQRSVTFPHKKKVPSLSINVESKRQDKASSSSEEPTAAIVPPHHIQRPKTAPPGSVSPVAPNFSRPKPPPTLVSTRSATEDDSASSPIYRENSQPPTPTSATTIADEDQTVAINAQTPPRVHPDPLHLESSRHMLTSNSSTLVAKEDPAGGSYPRVRSPEDLERQIVQVSVARQVSVSQARKLVQRVVESKQPLRPKVVELGKHRKSTIVLIEGGDD